MVLSRKELSSNKKPEVRTKLFAGFGWADSGKSLVGCLHWWVGYYGLPRQLGYLTYGSVLQSATGIVRYGIATDAGAASRIGDCD